MQEKCAKFRPSQKNKNYLIVFEQLQKTARSNSLLIHDILGFCPIPDGHTTQRRGIRLALSHTTNLRRVHTQGTFKRPDSTPITKENIWISFVLSLPSYYLRWEFSCRSAWGNISGSTSCSPFSAIFQDWSMRFGSLPKNKSLPDRTSCNILLPSTPGLPSIGAFLRIHYYGATFGVDCFATNKTKQTQRQPRGPLSP